MSLLTEIRKEYLNKISKLDNIISRSGITLTLSTKIKVIIGMRRTGKTYYLLETIQKLLNKGIDYSKILYLNLEDDRLLMNAKGLAELIEEFYAIYPENHQKHCYLFFDEIQTVEGWSHLIRRLHDTKEVDIYLTGSSAKLLSKEIATELRGRSIAYEMWPFSFKEYLQSQAIEPVVPHNKAEWDLLKKHLHFYLLNGGFPEMNTLLISEKIRVLQDYVDVVIYRDIVERHRISNLALIKYMIKYLIKNASTSLSMNKIYNDLKSQGYSVGRATIYEYVEHIQDAYLVFMAPLYSESIRKRQVNPRKIYTIDMGLSKAYSLEKNINSGRLFENMIYLDLKRRGEEVFFYLTEEKYEVDFLTRSLDGCLHLYQVAWNIEDPETRAREERALEKAEKELNVKGVLITPETYLTHFYHQ